jgi:hypothetical protein
MRHTSCSASVYSIRGLGGDVVAPLAVGGIAGAGMVARELDGDRAVLVLGDRRVQLGFLEHVLPM